MWQHWAFFLVLWIRVNGPGPFLPPLVCLLMLLWLGPPLEDLLALSHFLFPFSPYFVLLLLVALVRNYPFPAFNLRKYQPCHLLARLCHNTCPVYGVAHPCVHLYMLCRLSALFLAFQGTILETLFHICLGIPGTTGTHWTSASAHHLASCSVPAHLTTACPWDEECCLRSTALTSSPSFSVLASGSEALMVFVMIRRISTALIGISNLKIPLSKWRPPSIWYFQGFSVKTWKL